MNMEAKLSFLLASPSQAVQFGRISDLETAELQEAAADFLRQWEKNLLQAAARQILETELGEERARSIKVCIKHAEEENPST
jgi:urease accessory protein UreF